MSPRILFVTLLNDVGSDRIVAAMGRSGCDCAVLGPADGFAARSRFAGTRFPLPRLGGWLSRGCGFATRFRKVVQAWRPDLVIPLDDFTARTLRAERFYRAASQDVRALIERSFGSPDGFTTLCSRERQITLAAELGVRTPSQRTIATLQDAKEAAAAFGYPVVLKREQTCGGFGVAILENEADLIAAFGRASRKATMKRLVQTALRLTTADQNSLVMQQHIAGPMAFRVVACAAGTVLDGISFLAECVNPPGHRRQHDRARDRPPGHGCRRAHARRRARLLRPHLARFHPVCRRRLADRDQSAPGGERSSRRPLRP